MNIGKNIKKIRTQLGMTQVELAAAVNVNKSMIGNIETGRKLPSLMLAVDIAKILGCTVDEMCKD